MTDKDVKNNKNGFIAAFVPYICQGKVCCGDNILSICDKKDLENHIIMYSPYAVHFWVHGSNEIAAHSFCLSPLYSCPVIKLFGVDKRLVQSLYVSYRGCYKYHNDGKEHRYVDYSFMFNSEQGSNQKTMRDKISNICKNCTVRIAPNWSK